MKKLVKYIAFAFFTIVLIKFLIPSFISATNEREVVTIKGKALDENGNGVSGITVSLCNDKGEEYGNNYTTQTVNGEYSFQVIKSDAKYKLKFKHGSYNNAKAYIKQKEYNIAGTCQAVKVGYGVPIGERDIQIAVGREIALYNLSLGEPNKEVVVTYDENGVYYNENTTSKTNLYNTIKSQLGEMDLKNTKTIIILKINNYIYDLDSILKEIKNENTDNNEYKYFILLDRNLNDTIKSQFNNLGDLLRADICNNELELKTAVATYVGAIENNKEIEIGVGNDGTTITDTISNSDEKVILNGITEVNLKLGAKTQDENPNGNQDPTGENPGQEENQQHNKTTANNVANGEKIKGTIYIDGAKIEKPVYVKLTKHYNWTDPETGKTEERESSMEGHTGEGKFGFDYISTSSGRTK